MSQVAVRAFGHTVWSGTATAESGRDVTVAVERGDVVFLPNLRFAVSDSELPLFSPEIVGGSKNVGFDPATGKVGGTVVTGDRQRALAGMLGRFSDDAAALVAQLLPPYAGKVTRGRTSFRPVEIAGRKTSWRKDDTRLHIDAFPATPVHGRRILRVFANVNPAGRARTWRVGEPFERIAARFGPGLRVPPPGVAAMLQWLRVTKSRRTPYDALMLQLHDRMKADDAYQAGCAQAVVEFPTGSTWIAFTDQVSHAAVAGQYQLEQTFMLPVDAMQRPELSPLRVLERVKGRRLITEVEYPR
jgi:3-deoxy-D-manno-oct-2-ulosonic acid (Kdo) hydroxylase